MRRAAPATLRDDLNDAIRRLRAIERRGGGSLDDLDALDLFRIDVVDPACAATASLHRSLRGIAVHAHAVDVDDRIIAQRETARAPNADLCARADLAGRGQHDDAGRSSPDELVHGPRRRNLEYVRRLDRLDDVTDRALLHDPTCAGDYDLVELQ